jgi:hypothetical protein
MPSFSVVFITGAAFTATIAIRGRANVCAQRFCVAEVARLWASGGSPNSGEFGYGTAHTNYSALARIRYDATDVRSGHRPSSGFEIMRALGRFLQLVGLIVLPLALVLSLLPSGRGPEGMLSTWQELTGMAFGAALFCIGRLLEGYAKR